MIKIKKTGFTLSEMLIALSVVGVLAILVLPGVIKDSIGKANMALLQSSVGIMNDTVQNEMVKMGGSSNYANSKIATDPEGFLKNIDIAKSKGAGDLIFKPTGGYKNLDGGALSSVATTFAASAVLKNGAGVGLAAYDADAGYQVDLITTTQTEFEGTEAELLEGFKNALLAADYHGKMTGILHTRNDNVADTVTNEGTDILYGQDYFYEELSGLRFKITPFSFFQTNSLGAEVLYQTARDFIGDALPSGASTEAAEHGKVVFDLYSGTGTIAQMLSPVSKKVIGVEIIEEAVEAARENAELNHLHNCEFIAGDVLKVIDTIEEKPDYIVLDPPRDGINPKALEKIIRYNVPQMVYISCKPTSLARDLEVLQARGYEVKKVCCVDMFPNTVHVECVVALHRVDM